MPEMQLFDYQDTWNAVKPFAIPVIVWFIFAVVIAIFIGTLKKGLTKQIAAAVAMFVLPASLIYFILVGLGSI